MSAAETILIAIGLAMDAFAVALCTATTDRPLAPRAAFRLPFHFGLFQALMPVTGWILGTGLSGYVQAVDHWLAFGLLAFVGVRMVRSGLDPGGRSAFSADPSKGWMLVILSVATSIDALAIGFTLAMLRIDIWYPAATIGLVTGILTLAGMRLGRRLGRRFGRTMEVAGGLLLLVIGARILVSHLTA